MNPFRQRKKSHEGGEGLQRASTESDVPPIPTPSLRSRTFRRNKKKAEPQPEVNINLALPPTDDFRTSLLMPNLSARFSMLREQDDPRSKIGKANDDSVLFPKRASRLNLFGHDTATLSDIDEVSTLAGSIRPPFAYGRSQSYASTATGDDESSEGSVMNRSRPMEGNKFFGGRQKIYKIPVSEAASAAGGNGQEDGHPKPVKGRVLYEDDVSLSAFQTYREKAKQVANDGDDQDLNEGNSEHTRSESPPSREYNRNRETSSSTQSGPPNTRTSTAATSLTSQSASPQHSAINPLPSNGPVPTNPVLASKPPSTVASTIERMGNKSGQRLYGQGLNQQLQEQQTKSIQRLESVQRPRADGGVPLPKGLSQSRSATNLNDRYNQPGSLYASSSFRTASPQPSMTPPDLGGFDLGLKPIHPLENGRNDEPGFGRSPPLSPPMSPSPDSGEGAVFVASMEPNDLGKATASGAFSKPSRQYNEAQYAQRQLQMHEHRETPSPQEASKQATLQTWSAHTKPSEVVSNELHNSSQNSIPAAAPPQNFQFPAQPRLLSPPPKHARRHPFPQNDSFIAGMSGSESEAEKDHTRERHFGRPAFQQRALQAMPTGARSTKYEHDDQHPAFQNVNLGSMLDLTSDTDTSNPNTSPFSKSEYSPGIVDNVPEGMTDSLVLGNAEDLNGLNGLIRAHLRTDSDQSTVYPLPSPNRFPNQYFPSENTKSQGTSQSNLNPSFVDPFRNQNIDNSSQVTAEPQGNTTVPAPLSVRTRQILEHAAAMRNGSFKAQQVLGAYGSDVSPQQTETSESFRNGSVPKAQQVLGGFGADKAQQVLGDEAPGRSRGSSTSSWHEHLKGHHTRGGSTETQKEREEFASELADRRRRVQDNLKNMVDSGSRSASPMSNSRIPDQSPLKTGGAFGLLKKASRTSLVGRPENPPKAMKMLGMGPPSDGLSNPNQESYFERPVENYQASTKSRFQDTKSPNQIPRPGTARGPSPHNANLRSGSRDAAATRNNFSRRPSSPSAPVPRLNMREVAGLGSGPQQPKKSIEQQRYPERPIASSQDSSYRSQSDPRKYSPPRRPSMEQTRSHDEQRSRSALANRLRSNSRTYYEGQKTLQPLQTPSYSQHYPTQLGEHSPRGPPPPPGSTTYIPSASSPYYNPSLASPASSSTIVSNGSFPVQKNAINNAPRKRSISKHEISEPRFMSTTSSIPTVSLPPGASLQNGMNSPGHAPPVPPINPRRKRTGTTQNIFTTFGSNNPHGQQLLDSTDRRTPNRDRSPSSATSLMPHSVHTPLSASSVEPYEERSTFSDEDDNDKKRSTKQRLRKTSSEGGNLAAKARQYAMRGPSPAMPLTPGIGPGMSPMTGPGVGYGGERRGMTGMF